MNEDLKMTESIRDAINACTKRVDYAPSLSYRVLRKAKGEEPVKKKISTTLIFVLILVILAATAVAAKLLWKDTAEQVAILEREYGYYDTWNTEQKMELVSLLYGAGELKEYPDAERLMTDKSLAEQEKDALCDKVMCAFTGVGDRIDVICLESIVCALNGSTPFWSVEDKYWYNEMMEENGIPVSEETKYVLPEKGEITQDDAIRIARDLLDSLGDFGLDDTHPEPFLEEGEDGKKIWTIWYTLKIGGEYVALNCSVDLATDGTVLSYRVPEYYPLPLHETRQVKDAIPEEEAIEAGKKAIAADLGLTENNLTGVKAYFGPLVSGFEFLVSNIKHEQLAWVVDCEQDAYAVLSQEGNLLYIGRHK